MRMGVFLVVGLALSPCVLAAAPAPTPKQEVAIRCDGGETIGRALSKLDKTRPNVLNVYGTCQENVVIAGFDDLKIIGKAGATLLAALPETAYGIEVTASGMVSIEALTMRMTAGKTAMGLEACDDCRLKDVTVDGGIAVYALSGSYVTASRLTVTGSGGWTAIGAWHSAYLFIQDSSFEGGGRWCGLCVGENATANVHRSVFRHFGLGINADSGAFVQIVEDTTVEQNSCSGLSVTNGGRLRIMGNSQSNAVVGHVLNNGFDCGGGGIDVDSTSSLFINQTEVTGNNRYGIKLSHHAFARLGGGTAITSNHGLGLEVRNASMVVAPGPGNPPQTVEVSGNGDGDLYCDSISHINNGAQITGAASPQCPNLHPGDGP